MAVCMKKVLVLCTGNSCRSQMAEAYLKHFAAENVQVYSAGIQAHGLNLKAIQVMKEDGIDISNHTSNTIEEFSHIDFDIVITVCDHAKESCPYLPAKVMSMHYNFPDPAKAKGTEDQILNVFRDVRHQIKIFCKAFALQHLI
jgi:arsenate reductase